jgi:hypothetical protein
VPKRRQREVGMPKIWTSGTALVDNMEAGHDSDRFQVTVSPETCT